MRTVELEVVRYKTDEMVHASQKLMHDYASNTNPEWTRNLPNVLTAVADIINNARQDSLRWQTPGLHITFSGFPPVLPHIIEDRLVYSAKSPHFILERDAEADLKPATQKHVEGMRSALARQMHKEYGLEVERDEPLLFLTFPKARYSSSIEVVRAVVLP